MQQWLRKNKKHIVLLMLVCITLTLFFTTFFVVKHAGHSCLEETCSICLNVKNFSQKIKDLSTVYQNSMSSALLSAAGFICLICLCIFRDIGFKTPITLKVRMDD